MDEAEDSVSSMCSLWPDMMRDMLGCQRASRSRCRHDTRPCAAAAAALLAVDQGEEGPEALLSMEGRCCRL